MTENEGFSVVAATRTTQRFSTPGSSASCCALLNRWISSRNSTVTCWFRSRASLASSITRRTSRTPAVTADNST
jgi:hypothetical protein